MIKEAASSAVPLSITPKLFSPVVFLVWKNNLEILRNSLYSGLFSKHNPQMLSFFWHLYENLKTLLFYNTCLPLTEKRNIELKTVFDGQWREQSMTSKSLLWLNQKQSWPEHKLCLI